MTGDADFSMGFYRRRLIAVGLSVLIAMTATAGQPSAYRLPSAAITELLTAPAPPVPLVHGRSGTIALLHEDKVIDMHRLLSPRVELAGMRLDPITGISGIEPLLSQITVLPHAGETSQPVQKEPQVWKPAGEARLTYPQFSPDGRQLAALQVTTGQPSELWLYDIASDTPRRLSKDVSPVWGNPCEWLNNAALVCRIKSPQTTRAPIQHLDTPVVFDHPGGKLPTRTYSLLLENADDDNLFEYYYRVALARISTDGSSEKLAVTPGLIKQFDTAPDGQHILLRRLQPPYPRLVPARRFPAVVEVWDLAKAQAIFQSEPIGFGIDDEDDSGAELDSIQWRPGLPTTAGFLYRQPGTEGVSQYQWRTLSAPFTAKPSILARSDRPLLSFGWSSAGTPWYASRGESGEFVFNALLADGKKILWRGDRNDRYTSPGTALRLDGRHGPILEHEGHIYLAGDGLSDAGARPFLDRFNLQTGDIKHLYQAPTGVYAPVLALLDPEHTVLLTSSETETRPRHLLRLQADKVTTLYRASDPYPALQNVQRQRISYPRDDGVTLRATLYLPAKLPYAKPLPTLVWIYPREYDDPQQAQQQGSKPFQFHRVIGPSALAAVLEGYAVVVSPTVPIVSSDDGNGYLPQLVSSTDALVDYLVSKGISDPERIAIGGRSYGAFSAANLLIHSDKFASGIAMSGAYNRTLTPFGFQHEKRSFWEATDYYSSISPFFFANRLQKPLLLVHGAEDPNPGTPKTQARRFFHALVGEGTKTRYVELPGEEHHYRGRETVLYATWEMLNWLDQTVGPKAE